MYCNVYAMALSTYSKWTCLKPYECIENSKLNNMPSTDLKLTSDKCAIGHLFCDESILLKIG